ncbi:ATP-binding protein [Roseobacter sp. EG26]|uniref:sensor histidine kinase n=1 Tax=Roseobacter sp. EG26 TaxID=3412477 RepID=UPI003CE52CCD
MPLASLIRSEPFKAALRVACVFLVLYGAASWALVRSVETTLREDLATLTRIESELLTSIYQKQGRAGLTAAIAALSGQGQLTDRAYGLFDGRNLSLTGPLSVRPDFIGIDTREVSVLSGGRIAGRYVLWVDKLDALTLVVGRNSGMVEKAKARLTLGLGAFGGVLALVTIGLGLWAAYRSQRRLDEMETTLRRISRGDLAARLRVGARQDQFDRVASRMNENLARLERLVASVKSTASAIAHDLKTPLSHAQIAMQQAADAVEKGEDALDRIDDALAETDKLNSIFETVLRLSRIQATKDRSQFAPVALQEIAEKAVEFLHPAAEEQDQVLTITGGDATIIADHAMIQQAAVNLVQNACVHAGPGAQIEIGIGADSAGAFFRVRDDGPGIPPQALDTVRAPFARAAADRSAPGHGLGLALVEAIAELHDANLLLVNTTPGFEATLVFPNFKNS